MKIFSFFLLLLALAVTPVAALAQMARVNGTVVSANSRQPLPSTNVILINLKDTTKRYLAVSDPKGYFTFPNIPQQQYRVAISYIGFESYSKQVTISGGTYSLGTIRLNEKSEELTGTTVVGHAVRASVKGDTTSYNASSFKVTKDADAEQLIAKMPGITSENGQIKAQGEQVKKVLVDGKQFFGDDPTVALKSLPAEIIDKVEVFDKLSDQAEFTGFDDGNSSKTINIVTKNNRRTGQFGKLYGGYGTDERYNLGGNVNIFKGDARTSIIAMSNNVNQQNFSSEDILGVLGSSGGRGGMRGPGGGHGGPGGPSGPGGAGGGMSNFMVGQQNGITSTTAFGINFSDKWGQKVNFTGSYFFNYSNTNNSQQATRQYFGATDTAQRYTQSSYSSNNNYNNRINLRIEYNATPKSSFIFTPRVSFQSSRSSNVSAGETTVGPTTMLNKTENQSSSLSEGYNINNDILYRYKFDKTGRTFSISVGGSYSNRTASSLLLANNEYNSAKRTVKDSINQKSELTNSSYSINGMAIYTEPLGSKAQLMVNYNVGYTRTDNDKRTNAINYQSMQYTELDTSLSSVYQNDYLAQRVGLGLRLKGAKVNGMLNLMFETSSLMGDETFPVDFNLDKTYNNLLPMAMVNYKMNQQNSLRVMYMSRTQAPSISQLQSVVDNSDPLNLYVGNPNLNQSYSNNINVRYSYTSMSKGQTFFVFFNAQNTSSYIGSSTLLAGNDITLSDGTILRKGAQLNQPVNLNGYWNLSSMLTYGFPVSLIKSNVNISLGSGYSKLPAILNNKTVTTKTYSPNGGIVVGSNISPSFDFTLSHNAAYNIVESNGSNGDNNYWYQTSKFKLSWTIANRFTVLPEVSYQQYNGNDLYQDNLLVNMNIGVKLLKNRQAELKLGVFDLLNQNKSFSRTVNSLYIEDSYSSVLSRYFMLTFVYNLRNFKM